MKRITTVILCLISHFLSGFSPETVVKTNHTAATIKSILPEQTVSAFDGTSNQNYATVLQIHTFTIDSFIRITTSHQQLCCAPFQCFWIPTQGWIPAQKLKTGETLFSPIHGLIKISAIEQLDYPTKMYELSLTTPHTFCVGAEEVLTHNTFFIPLIGATAFTSNPLILSPPAMSFLCYVGKSIVAGAIYKIAHHIFGKTYELANVSPNAPPQPPESSEPITEQLSPQKPNQNKNNAAATVAGTAAVKSTHDRQRQSSSRKRAQASSQQETPPSEKPILPAQHDHPIKNELANLDDVLVKPLGRGSTGRTEPRNLHEQLAMKEVMSDPHTKATEITRITMTDPRWLKESGWTKRAKGIKPLGEIGKECIDIHYTYNKISKLFDDFKFKD